MTDPSPAPSRVVPVPLVLWPDRDEPARPPTPLAPLVGREREAAVVRALLVHPDVRLLTLTGPGGVGKTRLALRVAAEVGDAFPHGVAFVSLAPIRDPVLVPAAISHGLGLRDIGGREPNEASIAFLDDRAFLLVLDNFEQIIDAAPVVADLLAACPRLKVLVTSREILHLYGERAYLVPPLALPDLAHLPPLVDLSEVEAVRLFADRARSADSRFTLTEENASAVAAICARLDGLPLAIELAAARVAMLSPAALLARLEPRLPLLTGGARDLPARLRTMRNAIAWSYDLLDANEQALFRRLAVFVGGFSFDAAESVCATGLVERAAVLDRLASLVDKSLVRPLGPGPVAPTVVAGPPRFGMLETVREFGLEQLEASGDEPATRDEHAAWCLAEAEAAEAVLRRTDDPGAVARLESELANMRAALRWLEQSGRSDGLLRQAAAIGRFWYLAEHHREGRIWLEGALAAAPDATPPVRARALLWAGLLAHVLGDHDAAVGHLERAAALARRLNLADVEAAAALVHGMVLEDRGDYDGAELHFDAARVLARQVGDARVEAHATYHLGVAAYGQGKAARAIWLWEEPLQAARERGDAVTIAWCLEHLGLLTAELGDLGRAAAALEECLTLGGPVLHRHHWGTLLATLAVLGDACGLAEVAARLQGAAETAGGHPIDPPEGLAYARVTGRLLKVLGAATYKRAVAAGRDQGARAVNADARVVLAAAAVPVHRDPDHGSHGLTPREREILPLLAQRLTDNEIAERLAISPRTAMNHAASILGKLGLASRRDLAAFLAEHGLLPPAAPPPSPE